MATQPDMLQDEIARRTGQGWVLVLRDAAEAQMRKPKRFSILWFLAWTFLSFGTLFWVYLIWHWAKSEQLIFLRVVEGQLVVTGGGRGVFGAPVAAYWRWAGQRESTQGKVIAYGGPVVAVIVLIIIISVASATGGGGDGDGEQVAGQPTQSETTSDPTLTNEEKFEQAVVATLQANATATQVAHAIETVAARPTPTPRPTRTPIPIPYKLSLVSGSCTRMRDIGFIECEGFVKNITDQSLEFVEAVAIFVIADGTPVSSDSALIDYDPLLPGQSSPFTIIARFNPAFDMFRIEFKELLGGTILTRDDR